MSAPAGPQPRLPDPGFERGKGISWRRTSIISKLSLLLLAVGLPLSAVVAWSLHEVFQTDKLSVRQHAEGHALVVATQVEALVRETQGMLASVAARPAVRAMDPLKCDPFLDELRTTLPRYTSISTVDLEWRFVCSTSPLLRPTVTSGYTALYERSRATNDMVISGPLVSRLTGKAIVMAAYPVKDSSGTLAGLALAPIATASFGEALVADEAHADTITELRDSTGALIASYPEGRRIGGPRTVGTGPESKRKAIETGTDGIERIHASALVDGTDWTATTSLSMEPALASSRGQRRQAIAVSLLVFLLAGWLALVLARRITRPLRELERDARVMAAGNFDLRSRVAGPDEVGQLASAFNDMGLAVQAHEAMLRHAAVESNERQQRLGAIIGSALDAIVTIDDEGRVAETNPAARQMFGYGPGELEGGPVTLILMDRLNPARSPLDSAHGLARSGHGAVAPQVVRGLRKDGSELALEASISCNVAGGLPYMTAFLRDVTERLKADEQIRRLNRVHAVLTEINALIIRAHSREELFREACRIAVNDGAFRIAWVGVVDPQTLEGKLVALRGAGDVYASRIQLTARAGLPQSAWPACRALRERRPVISNDIGADPALAAIRDEFLESGLRSVGCFPFSVQGRVVGVIVLFAGEKDAFDDEETRLLGNLAGDISFALEQIDKQQRLDYLAYYDPLTGLANRALFLERAGSVIRGAASASRQAAVLLLDVERFRNVNDSLGRPAGDALLKHLGEWLASEVPDATLVARLDGDHFAALLPDVRDAGAAAQWVDRCLRDMREHPFILDDAVLRVDTKVGIALYPADGGSVEALLGKAEAALKKAKTLGERYLFHTREMTASAVGKLTLENQLRRAVENGDFALRYRPRQSLAGGKLTGAEALLEWSAPPTADAAGFMSVLEETGLVHEVGRWMVRQAIEDRLRWMGAGLPPLRVAINMSARQLRNRELPDDLAAALGIDPGAPTGLEIEIAEGVIMEDVKHSITTLEAVRAMGVTIAIDDFGAGFSSLRYLARLPADVLKIDGSFIADMTTGPQGLALVSTFIRLAHSLKLKVVAQDVTAAEQSRLLALLGCDDAQGSHIGEALSSGAFQVRFLEAGKDASQPARIAKPVPIGDKTSA